MNDDSKIIETIVRAHYDTCDYTRNKIEPFIQKAKTNPSYITCSGSVSKVNLWWRSLLGEIVDGVKIRLLKSLWNF